MTQGLPTTAKADLEDLLQAMTDDGGAVSEALARMSATALTASGLDERTAVLIRLAALVAMDASPVSYLVHLRLAESAAIDPATVRALLVELAPLVGTARIVSAADKAMRARLAPLHDRRTEICVAAERALLRVLDGSCRTPIAALAELDADETRDARRPRHQAGWQPALRRGPHRPGLGCGKAGRRRGRRVEAPRRPSLS